MIYNSKAGEFINENIKSAEEALQGARDIIAETVNEDAEVRAKIRKVFEGRLPCKAKLYQEKNRKELSIKTISTFLNPFQKFHRIEFLLYFAVFWKVIYELVFHLMKKQQLN